MPPDTDLTLAFDTSAAHVAAALVSGDRVLASTCELMQKGQAERLIVLLEELLAGAGKSWHELTTIGVGIGPGNFTGIRISVSAARGLALSLNIPTVGVSSFDALAYQHARPCLALVDARRDQFYVQKLDDTANTPRVLDQQELANLQENLNIHTVGPDTSTPDFAVAIACIAHLGRVDAPRPAPLYIRAADAAPPSDPAPTILP